MNKKLLLASVLLLICVLSVADFSLSAFAGDYEKPSPTEEPKPTEHKEEPTPTLTCTPTPEPSKEPTPTEKPSITPTPTITVTPTTQPSWTPTPTPTSNPSWTPTPTPTNGPTATPTPHVVTKSKGGKPVYAVKAIKKTPDTGAESFALLSLIPSILGGLYLRRGSK